MKNYFYRHWQAALDSFGHIGKMPFMSLVICLVIGIALALPTFFLVTLQPLQNLAKNLNQTLQITVFLKNNLTETQVTQIVQKLSEDKHISQIQTISPEAGLKELQEQTGFQGKLLPLQRNPLPWTLIVIPKNAKHIQVITSSLKKLPEVDSLLLDELWLSRLTSLLHFIKEFIFGLAIFLGVAIFLIVSHAIRSATQLNYKEIEVMKLIGATPAFIRRPFLYAGLLYGLLGGIIAWQLVDIFLLILKTPFNQLMALYQNPYPFPTIGLSNTLILLGCSIFFGLLGSWLATFRYLKML